MLTLFEESDEEEEEDDDEEEVEEEENDVESEGKENRVENKLELLSDEESDDGAKSESEMSEKDEEPPAKKTKLHKENERHRSKRLVKSYYGEGSYYGNPITQMVYNLASQLGRANLDYLWFYIISVTNNYKLGKLGLINYTQIAAECKEEVDRLTVDHEPGNKYQSGGDKNPDDKSIRFIEDLQLTLLRHWNLYDSMYHSTYVATKLGIWKQKGRQMLTNLLVKMGYPQKESKQLYKEMSVTFKKELPQKLADFAPRYNMKDIVFPSFERTMGFLTTVSSCDVVFAITALLDCGTSFLEQKGMSEYEKVLHARVDNDEFTEAINFGDGGLIGAGAGTRTTAGAVAAEIHSSVKHIPNDERQDWNKHFYLAYDALSNPRIIQHGILLSIYYQKILIEQALSILEKKLVQTLATFQLAIIKTISESDEIFGKSVPLLYRLMEFLMNAFAVKPEFIKEYKKTRLPFVMVAQNQDEYLVIGRSTDSKK
jgi:cell division control protein 45